MKDRPSQGNPHVQLTLGPVIQSFRPQRKNKSQTQMQTAINAQQIRRKNTKSKKTVRNALENQSQQTHDLAKVICQSFFILCT